MQHLYEEFRLSPLVILENWKFSEYSECFSKMQSDWKSNFPKKIYKYWFQSQKFIKKKKKLNSIAFRIELKKKKKNIVSILSLIIREHLIASLLHVDVYVSIHLYWDVSYQLSLPKRFGYFLFFFFDNLFGYFIQSFILRTILYIICVKLKMWTKTCNLPNDIKRSVWKRKKKVPNQVAWLEVRDITFFHFVKSP